MARAPLDHPEIALDTAAMNLAKTQLLSLATKAITTFLGIAQSFFIVHFLTKAEFGLAGLVVSIGSVIGVTQHLGVVDGAIREIAVGRGKREIGHLFWVSHAMRQVVTIPLSLGLFWLAPLIAERVYGLPEIVSFVRLYAVSLLLLGVQDVLGATLTGMKKFGPLYLVQIGTAALNVVIFAYFTARFATLGYFWAIIVTTAIMVAWYGYIVAHYLRGNLALPGWADMRRLVRRVFRISGYMYLSRILFVVWQRLPLLVLGLVLAKEQLGELNLSLTFGSKLTILAMALSEVNLSILSSLFVRDQREFQRVVTRNMQRLLFLLALVTTLLIFFTPEILQLPPLREYLPAQNLVIIMTVAFFIYALIDVGTSSVFVAADQPRWRAGVYSIMTLITGAVTGWVMFFKPDPLLATVGVLIGVLCAYGGAVWVAWRGLRIALLNRSIVIVLAALLLSMMWLLTGPNLLWRTSVFAVFVGYVIHDVRRNNLLPTLPSLATPYSFVCFSGAFYDAPTWTNRQHIMSRLAKRHPVLYVEPRIWIVRYILDHWRKPVYVWRFLKRVLWWETINPNLFIKAQWNLIPGSREYRFVGRLNHRLNRWNVRLAARLLGFNPPGVVWLYDTEGAEYLDVWPQAQVVYDCVDDHAVQAGPDRNAERVREEEQAILKRAALVTVTSRRLYEQKKPFNSNVHLVEQGADVELFTQPARVSPFDLAQGRPLIGSVGALDSYKFDFDLIDQTARAHPEWHFVFVGQPVVERGSEALGRVSELPNVTVIGAVAREEVPVWVHGFDVCIIPYRANDYNRSSFPLKFWEFMASGKPIVVSGLPELKHYAELIGYAESAKQFDEEIKKALLSPEVGKQKRISLAQEHSWEKRVGRLEELLKKIST